MGLETVTSDAVSVMMKEFNEASGMCFYSESYQTLELQNLITFQITL